MNGLGDPERIVIDCAGDQWYVRDPGGAPRAVAAPGDVHEFVAPAEAARRWSRWLAEVVTGSTPCRAWIVHAPSVFGAPRRSLIAAGAAALGVHAEVVPRAEALVVTHGLLYCRRALVLECRGPVAQAHVLDFADGAWRPVAAAAHPDPVTAARSVFDDRVDQALVDGPPDVYAAVRHALAAASLWRVVRVDPGDVVPAIAATGVESWSSARASGGNPTEERGRRRWPVAAAAVVSVAGVAAGAVACLPGSRPSAPEPPRPPQDSFVRVAFDGGTVDLPKDWAVTEPAPSRRTAQAEDGRRVTVVRTALRAESDRAKVAAELESALAHRSDRRITDLDPTATVAGREVIGYRERLDSERFVDWYVVVAGSAQLSVGCEAGRTAAPLAGVCERAVASVRSD